MNNPCRLLGGAIFFATSWGAAAIALAQTPPSLADCAAISADSERLACYDRVSGRGRAASAPAPVVPAPMPETSPAPAPAPVVGASVAPAATPRAPASLIDAAWNFNPDSERYVIEPYHQNYLLVGRWTNNVNTAPYEPLFQAAGQSEKIDSTEAKFQLSFKARLWTTNDRRWGVWAAYTQQNQWQVYNADISRPFRETNYMPEAFVSYRPGVDLGGGFRWNLLNVGLNHQSNGRTDSLSRSWNRAIATFGVERENFAVLASVWYRLKEDEADDDNPDITDYYGYGSLTAVYKWREHSFTLIGRGNVRTGKGAAQLAWMSPRLLGPIRAYAQAFSGYGESMIDYNWNQTTIGVGVAINDEL
jgi:phospholipase A1